MLYNLFFLFACMTVPKNADFFNQYFSAIILEKQFELSIIAQRQDYIHSSYFAADFQKKNYFAISDTFIQYLAAVPLDKDSVLISEIVSQYLAQIEKFKAKYKGNYVLAEDLNLINGFTKVDDISTLLSYQDLSLNTLGLGYIYSFKISGNEHYSNMWNIRMKPKLKSLKEFYTNAKVNLEKIQAYAEHISSVDKDCKKLHNIVFKGIDFSQKEMDLQALLAIVDNNCQNIVEHISPTLLTRISFFSSFNNERYMYPYSTIEAAIIK